MNTSHATDDQRDSILARYKKDGFCFPVGEVPLSLVSGAAQNIDALLTSPPEQLAHPWTLKAHLLFDWIYELTIHPSVLDAVEAVIGPNLLMQAADIFAKPGNSIKHVNWHQDANYWNLEPFEVCTAWIALTDVFPKNGCMRFLPGTHTNQKLEHNETFADDSALTRGREIALDIDENKAVPVILCAGQISLHHCLFAHASGPNSTESTRIVRYMSTHVRQTNGPPMCAILVRGSDDFGHFPADDPPTGDMNESAIQSHARAMQPHASENYSTA